MHTQSSKGSVHPPQRGPGQSTSRPFSPHTHSVRQPYELSLEQMQNLTPSCHSLVPISFISDLDSRETSLADLAASVQASLQPTGTTMNRVKLSHRAATCSRSQSTPGAPISHRPVVVYTLLALSLLPLPLVCSAPASQSCWLTRTQPGGHISAPVQLTYGSPFLMFLSS